MFPHLIYVTLICLASVYSRIMFELTISSTQIFYKKSVGEKVVLKSSNER